MKQEIIGARILYPNGKDLITTDKKDIADAIESDYDFQFLTRQHMQIMAAADLGRNWENLAKSRTIFITETEDDKLLYYPTTITYNDQCHYIKFDSNKTFVESIKHHFTQLGENQTFVESITNLIADELAKEKS